MTTPETDPPVLSPRQSTELLEGLDGLRRHGRRATGAPWVPLLLFGAFTVLTAPLAAAFGMPALGPAWIVGGAVAFALIFRYYRRRAERTGIGGRGPELMVGGAVTFAACFAIAAVGGKAGNHAGPLLGPPLVVLLAYAFVGWYQGSPAVAVAVVPGVAAAGVLFAVGASPPLVLLAFGLGMVGAAGFVRLREVPA